MRTEELAAKFLKLSLVNGVLAIVFTVPILFPSLCIATPPGSFGCKATMDIVWPGTWVLVAWLVFVTAGVLGSMFFGAMYYFADKLSNKTTASSTLGWLHIAVYEVGVLGATGMMAAIGFVGGSYVAQGGNVIVSSQVIRNMLPSFSNDPTNVLYDMPPVVEAVFIAVALLGALIGFVNYLRLRSER